MGSYILPRWSWFSMRIMDIQKIGLVGFGFPRRAGWYHMWMDSDPLSCPGYAYFVYKSYPMNEQTKLTCLYSCLVKLKSKILGCQNR